MEAIAQLLKESIENWLKHCTVVSSYTSLYDVWSSCHLPGTCFLFVGADLSVAATAPAGMNA